jgi:hypothetical protein
MDSDEAGLYVASTEEAELKGLLWSTMNRWVGQWLGAWVPG